MGEVTVAYAVHVEGALWDDPEISAWCESIHDAATMMEKAAAFFADDNDGVPLLTIVRAEFTPEEWAQVVANEWAFGHADDDGQLQYTTSAQRREAYRQMDARGAKGVSWACDAEGVATVELYRTITSTDDVVARFRVNRDGSLASAPDVIMT